ncbi:MAG: hypothetical protein FJW22_02115 [Acidimicrobiia bacterium]|nr:hypothetical protein [Acidimicrobiia bacterium]
MAFPGTLDQHPSIDYRGRALTDVVSTLQTDVAAGTRDRRRHIADLAASGFGWLVTGRVFVWHSCRP